MAKRRKKTSEEPVGSTMTAAAETASATDAQAAPRKPAKVRSRKKTKGTPPASGIPSQEEPAGGADARRADETPAPSDQAPVAATALVQPAMPAPAAPRDVEPPPPVTPPAEPTPPAAAPVADAGRQAPDDAEAAGCDQIVEMSAEEALAFLTSLKPTDAPGAAIEDAEFAGPDTLEARPVASLRRSSRRASRRRPEKTILDAGHRVLTFESARVEAGMRVAGSTLARLYGMVRNGEIDVGLGPICQTLDEFAAEVDRTPEGVEIIILANLDSAASFLASVAALRPEVGESFWIVYETLRSDLSAAKHVFLAQLRAANRARAIGYGPRNVVEAARRGAEAVRGYVEWGFGRRLSTAS